MGLLGGAGLAGASPLAAAGKHTQFYMLETYQLKNGSQVGRIHEFLGKGLLPALNKVHSGPKIFLEATIGPHVPQVAAIIGFSSMEEIWHVHNEVNANAEVAKAVEKWESDPEPAFEQQTNTLLQAADYSPEVQASTREQPRLFELRTYHSPTWKQLHALHERFAGPEIKIFHRSGIYPILYTSTMIGANMPNLTYLIPFDNLAAREKAWDAFTADSEWAKVRKESIDRHGQIASVIQVSFFKATAYSPVK